jgi:hypothetical protein
MASLLALDRPPPRLRDPQPPSPNSVRGSLVETPVPATLPLLGTALGILGLINWRRKRKAAAEAI